MSNTKSSAALQFGYDAVKALAAELRLPLKAVITLSDDNDPYLADRPGRRLEGAQWFAALWSQLEIPNGVHLRRLHYLLVSTATIVLPNGRPYENTHGCWKCLGGASADARFLDLVPAGAFVDRRAPEPIVYIPDDEGRDAAIGVCDDEPSINEENVPLLDYEPQSYTFPELPDAVFTPPTLTEPYALEIWIEKSTVNDILLPLARTRGVTLVTGVGELSITACLGKAGSGARSAHQNSLSQRLRPSRPGYADKHRQEDSILPRPGRRQPRYQALSDPFDRRAGRRIRFAARPDQGQRSSPGRVRRASRRGCGRT